MNQICLKFEDILQLVEFLDVTKNHHCEADMERMVVSGELSDADVELAINGYGASLMPNS